MESFNSMFARIGEIQSKIKTYPSKLANIQKLYYNKEQSYFHSLFKSNLDKWTYNKHHVASNTKTKSTPKVDHNNLKEISKAHELSNATKDIAKYYASYDLSSVDKAIKDNYTNLLFNKGPSRSF